MVIDSSVLLAILFDEPEAPLLEAALEEGGVRLLSAGSLLEAGIVVERRYGQMGSMNLDLLVHQIQPEIVPVDRDQVEAGREAYRRFGKGNHPAKLNFGDCFAYALARVSGEPLLYKGEDFGRTDIAAVAWQRLE